MNSGIRVVARISDPDFFDVFRELEVTDLIYPEFEAGLEMIRQVLLYLRIPVPEIQHHTENLRHQLLTQAATSGDGYRTLGQMRAAEQQFDLQWVEIETDNPLIDQSIAEAEIRKTTGVSVVGIIRSGTLETNPDPSFRFRQHDLVAIIGSAEARQKFHCFLNPLSEQVPCYARKAHIAFFQKSLVHEEGLLDDMRLMAAALPDRPLKIVP